MRLNYRRIISFIISFSIHIQTRFSRKATKRSNVNYSRNAIAHPSFFSRKISSTYSYETSAKLILQLADRKHSPTSKTNPPAKHNHPRAQKARINPYYRPVQRDSKALAALQSSYSNCPLYPGATTHYTENSDARRSNNNNRNRRRSSARARARTKGEIEYGPGY